jgi:hypothetical protein
MLQYLLNLALLSDLTLSTVLGGYPRDTVSARIARARLSGSRPACVACAVMTWVGNTVFKAGRDHCTWALDASASIGRQVWNWGTPR